MALKHAATPEFKRYQQQVCALLQELTGTVLVDKPALKEAV